jgi:ERAP1-like C-terminal domain
VMPNADGAGYYRWTLPAQDLGKLRAAGFGKLSAREKLSFADSLRAGFESGALPAERVLGNLPVFAGDADRTVATAPTELLRFVRTYLLEGAQRDALDGFARELYAPRLHKLGWKEQANESGDQKLLRADLASFLASVIRDKATRASLAELGRRHLGLEGKHAGDAVAVDLQTTAAIVAVQDGDQKLWDAVYKRFIESTDALERDRLLVALSAVTDARSEKALALTLDPRLRVNEVGTPLRYQFGDERTREAAWKFLQEHFDAIVARVSKEHAGFLPSLPTSFCSAQMADTLQAFFAPRIEQLTGGPLALSASVESLRNCAARVEQQRASARAFFEHRK